MYNDYSLQCGRKKSRKIITAKIFKNRRNPSPRGPVNIKFKTDNKKFAHKNFFDHIKNPRARKEPVFEIFLK